MGHLRLGPFELHALIARGGMGQVWRAVHAAQRVPVAVKVLTVDLARKGDFAEAFRREVRAMAQLHHPGIVTVLDAGDVPANVTQSADFVPGSPYLVMEWVEGRSLSGVGLIDDWGALQPLLLRVLDALAHAHALGVVHRDIKPGNILFGTDREDGLQVKITDFGIARSLDVVPGEERAKQVLGTPSYMAPEQAMGHIRDQGPWTDLYALGCLCYRLMCGAPPFQGADRQQVLQDQVSKAPPELKLPDGFPPEFAAWVEKLLVKDPYDRFRSAADAGYDLSLLPSAAASVAGEDSAMYSGMIESDTRPWRAAPMPTSTPIAHSGQAMPELPSEAMAPLAVEVSELAPTASTEVSVEIMDPARLPLERDWRNPVQPMNVTLLGAGLGLYHLRQVPLVGREAERDTLWQMLCEVWQDGRARVGILRGTPGTGKTRLAGWTAQRAHEVAGATIMRARHSQAGGHDALADAVRGYLRVEGLTGEAFQRRVSRVLHHLGPTGLSVRVLEDLLTPQTEDARVVLKAEERHTILYQLMARIAAQKPIVLVLDDAQLSPNTMAFVQYLLFRQASDPCSILALLVVDPSKMERESQTDQQLAILATQEDVTLVELGLLESESQSRLVKELLYLSGDLADYVTERTAGNPLFAIQLVGDWVQRGVLEVRGEGFHLREGEHAIIPNSIHDLWMERVEQVVKQQGGDASASTALGIAAALGGVVNHSEWVDACRAAKTTVPTGLLDVLLARRLAYVTNTGWGFSHGMLRESVERAEREAERYEADHRACADMIQTNYKRSQSGVPSRLAFHMLEAGALEDALLCLYQAARQATVRCDFDEAHRLFETRERVMRHINVPLGDRRWGIGMSGQTLAYHKQGKLEMAARLSSALLTQAVDNNWRDLEADAHYHRGLIANKRGDVRAGVMNCQKGLEIYRELEHKKGMANCLFGLGELHKLSGKLPESAMCYETAIEHYKTLGDLNRVGMGLAGLSDSLRRMGDLDGALDVNRQAHDRLKRVGNHENAATALLHRGDILRLKGQLAEAEGCYNLALKTYRSIGSVDAAIATLKLALIRILAMAYSEALELIEKALGDLTLRNREAYTSFALALAMPCLAVTEDWIRWDEHHKSLISVLSRHQVVDEDLANALEMAARVAHSARQPERARRVMAIALDQWRGLERTERVESLSRQWSKL